MTQDWAKAPFEQMISDLRKEAPAKCQSCECLFANYRDGAQGTGWYMDCETKPDCYQDEPLTNNQKPTEPKP